MIDLKNNQPKIVLLNKTERNNLMDGLKNTLNTVNYSIVKYREEISRMKHRETENSLGERVR